MDTQEIIERVERLKVQSEQFIAGVLSEDETMELRRGVPSSTWLSLLHQQSEREVEVAAAAVKSKKDALIAECLAPLLDTQGDQELMWRQIRLLAAILEGQN